MCQQKLVDTWYKNIRNFSKLNIYIKCLIVFIYGLILPILMCIYCSAPCLKITKIFSNQPFLKFLNHIISYFVFVCLIILTHYSQYTKKHEIEFMKFSLVYPNRSDLFKSYANNEKLKYRFTVNDFYFRSDNLDLTDIFLLIWLIGFIKNEIKQIYNNGFQNYIFFINNYLDISFILFFLLSFSIKFYTIYLIQIHKNKILNEDFWNRIVNLNESNIKDQQHVYSTFYWLNADRFYWESNDLFNIYEGFFALATFLTICRICFYLPANRLLGPLHIMFISMIRDIFKFIIIFLIIFLAYLFSLSSLFWHYDLNIRKKTEINSHINIYEKNNLTKAEMSFGTIETTFKSIFWALFGYGDPNSIKLFPFKNNVTESFGLLLYGTFHIALTIILMNMLIAMLAKSYDSIQVYFISIYNIAV
jgi:hypothetical protein